MLHVALARCTKADIETFNVDCPLLDERNFTTLASVGGMPAMTIEIRANGSSVAIVDLAGRLTAGFAIACLHDQVDDLLRRNFAKIVLNMRRVDLVDCTGIGQLISCFCKISRQGGGLKLVHVDRRLHALLALFRVESVLETFESEQAAINSLTGVHTDAPISEQPFGTEETLSCPSKDPVTGSRTAGGPWY
jgi:anti-sigma B factor antagonist